MTKKIKVIALGGLGEIGKNMAAIGYDNEYIIVDAGMKFPDDDMNGVDIVIPDFTFVKENLTKIKGLFITHGHEDHIGAVPYFMEEFPNIPVYATKLTTGMILNKLKYHKIKRPNLKTFNPDNDTKSYKNISVSFFRTVHSIFDSVAIVVGTPLGSVVHTGDFKIDYSPIDGKPMDLQKVAKIGSKGVKLLISDSTNAEKKGFSISEREVADNLKKEMIQTTGKTIISTFASSLPRIQSILNISKELGKKVFVVGTSMKKNIKLSRELGQIQVEDELIINPNELRNYNDNELVIVATGAQGEPMAGLNRLSTNDNKHLRLASGDTVILSSGIVPGNEKSVGELVNNLLKKEVKVVQGSEIHTSGHGYQEEMKMMISLLQPEYFMPFHGEYRMLRKHKELSISVCVDPKKTFVCENGQLIKISEEGAVIINKPNNPTLIDYSGLAGVNINVLRDRRRLSEQGLLVVSVKILNGNKIKDIHFELKGIAARVDKQKLKHLLAVATEKRVKTSESNRDLKRGLVNDYSDLMQKLIKRRPLIVPLLDLNM